MFLIVFISSFNSPFSQKNFDKKKRLLTDFKLSITSHNIVFYLDEEPLAFLDHFGQVFIT